MYGNESGSVPGSKNDPLNLVTQKVYNLLGQCKEGDAPCLMVRVDEAVDLVTGITYLDNNAVVKLLRYLHPNGQAPFVNEVVILIQWTTELNARGLFPTMIMDILNQREMEEQFCIHRLLHLLGDAVPDGDCPFCEDTSLGVPEGGPSEAEPREATSSVPFGFCAPDSPSNGENRSPRGESKPSFGFC